MQKVFDYRDEVINEYQSFFISFTNISASYIKAIMTNENNPLSWSIYWA